MLKLVRFEVSLPPDEKINISMASLFHGLLMENVSANVAASLHAQTLRPFSQCVYFDREQNKAFWRIGTLSGTAYEQIIAPLVDKRKFFLRQKNWQITLSEPKILLDTSCEQLADEIFPQSNSPRSVNLQILTPTAFKHEGNYVILPEKFFIVNSLLQRWNTFSEDFKLEDINLAVKLSDFCRLTRYNLNTRQFALEKTKIPGFTGQLEISFGGNDMINRILGLLFKFATFSGVGIKTALGMGAVTAEIFWRDNR